MCNIFNPCQTEICKFGCRQFVDDAHHDKNGYRCREVGCIGQKLPSRKFDQGVTCRKPRWLRSGQK